MLKYLKTALGPNPRFGSAINRDYMKNLLDELKPQFGCLHHVEPAGTVVAITTTPAQLTIFDDSRYINDQIIADDTTNDITISNTEGGRDAGFFGQFGADITGMGLVVNSRISTSFNATGSNLVNIEMYADGIATGIKAVFPTKGVEDQSLIFGRLEIPNDVAITYYIYSSAGSFNVTFTQLSVDLEKMSLGVSDDAVLAVGVV